MTGALPVTLLNTCLLSMHLTLVRRTSDDRATTGFLFAGDTPICYTLELPYRDNRPRVSAIPLGSYQLIRYSSRRFGSTFLFRDVPSRGGILFHPGNVPEHSKGCILVGHSLDITGPVLGRSRLAFEHLMGLLTGVDTATIDIVSG